VAREQKQRPAVERSMRRVDLATFYKSVDSTFANTDSIRLSHLISSLFRAASTVTCRDHKQITPRVNAAFFRDRMSRSCETGDICAND
jgi:hypothetical protein